MIDSPCKLMCTDVDLNIYIYIYISQPKIYIYVCIELCPYFFSTILTIQVKFLGDSFSNSISSLLYLSMAIFTLHVKFLLITIYCIVFNEHILLFYQTDGVVRHYLC